MINSRFLKVISSIIFVLFVTLVLTGYKRFVVWPQITDYYTYILSTGNPHLYCETLVEQKMRLSSGLIKIEKIDSEKVNEACQKTNLKGSVGEDHPIGPIVEEDLAKFSHMIRIGLFYPIIEIALTFGLNVHLVFSIFCLLSIIFMSFILGRLFSNTWLAMQIYIVFFCLLSLFMNGRMIMSYLSIAVLIWALNSPSFDFRKTKDLLLYLSSVFVAMALSNVSSGINVIVLILFLYHVVSTLRHRSLPLWTWISISLICLFQAIWAGVGLAKNIVYFGGNIFEAPLKMINHGLGQLTKFSFALPILLLCLPLLAFLAIKFHKYFHDNIGVGFLVFIAGGLFGLSVLSMALVFLVTLILKHCMLLNHVQSHSKASY